jgi:N-acetyl-anhydromuramyl-L-alanine amidase AmpD
VVDGLAPYFGESGGNELFYPSKADRPWKYIVLHHSAGATGSYDQIDREHRKILGYDGCGYHFVIGNGTGSEDGQIEVAQRWVNQKHGVHCRNAKNADIDEYGIGICFVGDLDKEPPTARQVAAAKALIGYLSTRYRITRSHVETHAHLAATPTVCPGRHFRLEALVASKPRTGSEETAASLSLPGSPRLAGRQGPGIY